MSEHFNEPATMITLTAESIKAYADEHGIKLTRRGIHRKFPNLCARYTVAHAALGEPAARAMYWEHLQEYGFDAYWGDLLESGFEDFEVDEEVKSHPAYLEGVKLAKLAGY